MVNLIIRAHRRTRNRRRLCQGSPSLPVSRRSRSLWVTECLPRPSPPTAPLGLRPQQKRSCWPKMGTLAKTLGRSIRTAQRHLHLLKDRGLIEFVERRRNNRGRFSSYLYRVVHIGATIGHGSRGVKRDPNIKRTKRSVTPPISPSKEGYDWLFDGGSGDPKGQAEYERDKEERRQRASQKRTEGYEWLFG